MVPIFPLAKKHSVYLILICIQYIYIHTRLFGYSEKEINIRNFMTEYVEEAFGECNKLKDPTNRVGGFT